MIKDKRTLESIVTNRVGHFIVDHDCPIELAEQMLLYFMQELGKIKERIKAAQEAQNQKQSEVVPQEAPKE
jgi:hypothetical protein